MGVVRLFQLPFLLGLVGVGTADFSVLFRLCGMTMVRRLFYDLCDFYAVMANAKSKGWVVSALAFVASQSLPAWMRPKSRL
jgi:hypothetical protein